MNASRRPQHDGFSLIEIAVVLVIISVLVTMVAVPLATQIEQRRGDDTRKQIELAKEALIGFAMANGRMPCPANPDPASTTGAASYCQLGTGSCTATTVTTSAILAHGKCAYSNGMLPAVTLGIAPVDAQGYAVDAWQDGSTLHRIRYAVSKFESPAGIFPVTSTNGIRTATMDTVAIPASVHLYVCGLGLTAASSTTACSVGVTTLNDRAVAVVYSVGKNATTAFASLSFDEQNNQGNNADIVFTSGDTNTTFDDIVSWISINTLFARMVQAGKLP